jgi:RNase P subunit RPR2
MVNYLLSFFCCTHQHYTFPLTIQKGNLSSTYVVCLNCGKEFEYDWAKMKVSKERNFIGAR